MSCFDFNRQQRLPELGVTKQQVQSLTVSLMALDLTSALATVTVPITVACGTRDIANRGAAKRLTQIMPNATLTHLPGGHELNRAQPEQFAAVIQKLANQV